MEMGDGRYWLGRWWAGVTVAAVWCWAMSRGRREGCTFEDEDVQIWACGVSGRFWLYGIPLVMKYTSITISVLKKYSTARNGSGGKRSIDAFTLFTSHVPSSKFEHCTVAQTHGERHSFSMNTTSSSLTSKAESQCRYISIFRHQPA